MSHFLIYQGEVLLAKVPEEGNVAALLLAFGLSREQVKILPAKGVLKNARDEAKGETRRKRKRFEE